MDYHSQCELVAGLEVKLRGPPGTPGWCWPGGEQGIGFVTQVEKGPKVQWAMQGRGFPSGAPLHPQANSLRTPQSPARG